MRKTPAWMTVIIVILTLPAFSFPWLLSALHGTEQAPRTLVGIYPFYMLLSGWLAWKAYPQRAYVSWILLAVMVLSTIAVYMLTTLD